MVSSCGQVPFRLFLSTNALCAALLAARMALVQEVFLCNNSAHAVEVEESSTARDVCYLMARKLGLLEVKETVKHFALFLGFDGITHTVPARESATIAELRRSCARLVFKIAALSEACMRSPDPAMSFLRFIQAVHDINTGVMVSRHVTSGFI
jgi:hypothetical protein